MVRKRLFFDIETSFNVGIFWRSGYNLTINPGDIIHERAIICICYKWESEDDVQFLTWDKKQSDKAMIKAFLKVMAQATEIVAHNGDRFDLKWIRTRALLHGVDVMPSPKTIDTLKWARKYFNFNSNKLDYIAKYLGVGQKMDTGGLDLWKDIVFKKDQQAMNKMVGRSGYNLTINPGDIIHERAIICICYKWESEDDVQFLTWDKKQSDKAMIKAFLKVMAQADEIVAHNGDKFDLKWLRTRALLHGIDVMPSPKTIDTLKWARKYFNFNSNKLDYIAKYLGVGQKMDTGGLDLWKDIVFKKDQEAMNKMVAYCKMDVTVLEAVFNKLNSYTTPSTHYAVMDGDEKYCCPECTNYNVRHNKQVVTAAGTVHYWMRCNDCKKHFKINNKTYIEFLKFKYKH
jgi:uncharacterized protein YprB with RNaseH-like and TPR domain